MLNANPRILHFKIQYTAIPVPLLHPDKNFHFPFLRKLDRISDQVHKYLTQTKRVSDQKGLFYLNLPFQLKFFFFRLQQKNVADFIDQLMNIKCCLVKLKASRINLRKIKNLVDELQKPCR